MTKLVTKEGLETVLKAVKNNLDTKADKANLEDTLSYGVEWDETAPSPKCIRIGNLAMHKTLPIQNSLKGCIFKDGKVQYYLNPTDWTKKEDGSAADFSGADGDVMVHHMKFYGKGYDSVNGDTNKKQVRISPFRIDDTWVEIPEGVISAYRVTLDRTDSTKLKAVSVINTTANFRGGNDNPATDGNLAELPFKTLLGKPVTNITRTVMRQFARNNNVELLDYDEYKWVLYWLFVIEYATFYNQDDFTSELTSEGYHQGGLGPGVTNFKSWNQWAAYNVTNPIVPCGYTNEFGNFSGVKKYNFPSTETNAPATIEVNRYRGIEQPFGDIWTNIEGIVIYVASDHITFYKARSTEDYSDSYNEKKFNVIRNNAKKNGFISKILNGDKAEIIPTECNGSATSYMTDFFIYSDTPDNNAMTLLVGGNATDGGGVGFGGLSGGNAVSYANVTVGYRTCYKFINYKQN